MSLLRKGTIGLASGQLFFDIECAPHVAIMLRRVFEGAHRKSAGSFWLSATSANAHKLEWFMSRHPLEFVDDDTRKLFGKLVREENKRLKSIIEIETEDYVPPMFELALPPRDYQRIPADLALRTNRILIADDLGLGKTIEAICALSVKRTLPALVVAMSHLQRQWERQIALFAPSLSTHRIQSTKPYKFRGHVGYRGGEPFELKKQPDVLITTYNKLDGWADLLASICRTVIFDEIQDLRHASTKKYAAAMAISKEMAFRIGLSATPIYNYGKEIFNVCDVLSPGELGTESEFISEWCGKHAARPEGERPEDRDKMCVTDPAALGTHLRSIGMMIRRTRKDVGRELPGLTVVRHVVEIDRRSVDEVSADVAELAKRVLARAGSGHEIMQWSNEIDWRMRQVTGIAKAPGVIDLVRLLVESGERVLLFAWHHEVYAQYRSLLEKHGIRFLMYTGAETEKQKDENLQAFIRREADVLIMSLRAGAGTDGLQHVSRTVVIGELDWSPKVIDQDIARVNRDGQPDKVMAYIAVAEEGSDPVIADVLGLKNAQATGITDPDKADKAVLTGATGDHVRRLAIDVLTRRGIPIPTPPPKDDESKSRKHRLADRLEAAAESGGL